MLRSREAPMKNGKWMLAFAMLTVMLGMACNSKPNANGSSTVVANKSGNSNQIIGAGSTFVYPIMSKWIEGFQQQSNGVQINYQSIGSGGGIQQLKKGLVDFGASDASLDDEALKGNAPMLQIPESAGPVCITYNLPALKTPLKLTPKALAGIFLGTIKTWKDPEIVKANAGAALPNTPIVVAHRTEGSGTTGIFTTYLSAVSPEWLQKVGKGTNVQWPVGLGGKGSEGVTGIVKQSPGSVGYVELTYALGNNLPVAEVQNSAGKFVAPSSESASAAIAAFADNLAADVRTPIVNPSASAAEAYPISGLTFLMVTTDGPDAAKRAMVKRFIKYVVSDGQKQASGLHYAPLPPALIAQDQKLLDQMTADGKPLQ
ncbi:MAG TPA: phosphate ABC transporter substrate-binding protein PstS [Candidatus Saccharimonadales bacterium]|nr:phosphate ABC transporter substrate-binding protein PstS [Candidatus Saccharimonadales bacterium]